MDNTNDTLVAPSNFYEDLQINQEVNDFSIPKEDEVYVEQIVDRENKLTPEIIESTEVKMKDRIAQCKSIIDSLRLELNEEKARLDKEVKIKQINVDASKIRPSTVNCYQISSTDLHLDDLPYSSCIYSTCVENKLNCDENLMEYEKQLQKYQNTLNIAQNEKKNAIRKQMLAKAYRLKLLEVENQCNIELLKVKQSLQCLEPLKLIASKWKTNTDEIYDVTNFEFIPRYPELNAISRSDLNSYKEDLEDKNINVNIDDIVSYDN